MPGPDASDLTEFTGRTIDATQGDAVIQVVTALASSYTRGRGFVGGEPAADLRAVILSASARYIVDPSQMVSQNSLGPFSVSYHDGAQGGWTVAEKFVLNRYRVRAQ